MFRILALGLVISTSLVGTQVDFISTFPVEKHAPRLQMAKQTGFNIRYFNWDFHKYYQLMYSKQAAKINKIIFMSADVPFLNEFFMVPKKKRIAFYWEPHTSIENDAYWNRLLSKLDN